MENKMTSMRKIQLMRKIQKYEKVLPKEIIELWKKTDMQGTLLNGYLRLIDPDVYKPIVDEVYWNKKAIPVFSTVFGDVIIWCAKEDGVTDREEIDMLSFKDDTDTFLGFEMERFLEFLENPEYVLDRFPEYQLYPEAVKRLGRVSNDECYFFVPYLFLGGEKTVERLQKGDMEVCISIMTQLIEGYL